MKLFRGRPAAPNKPPVVDDPLAAYRIDDPREVLSLLSQLRSSATALSITAPGGISLGASLWTLEPEHQRLALEMEAGAPQLPALVDSNEADATAWLDSVKLQFPLQDLMLVRSTKATALQARLPNRIYRFQRRGAFRVRTLERGTPSATFRHPGMPDMLLRLRVVDISTGGCALLLPTDVPPLPLGTLVQGAVLEMDGDTRLACGLLLQHVSALGDQPSGLRLGCELQDLDPLAVRQLQRYIDQTQKRRRLLSVD